MTAGVSRRPVPRLACWLVAACAAWGTAAYPGSAQVASVREADIKAGFLYNFARFVEWPADAFAAQSAPLRIEVLGRDPFDGHLDRVIAGKMVNQHPITVVYTLSETALPSGHIVVISSSEEKRVQRLLGACAGKPMLTVSEIDRFVEAGGTIGFVPDGDNIRFAVNIATAREARLRIDSRMLAVARAVVNSARPIASN
jgi:YfiR/HmsC-like